MIHDEILKSIQIYIDVAMKNLTIDIECVIVGQKSKKYIVSKDDAEYTVKNGTNITFNEGDRCLVHCINGNFNDKVIIAKL